MEYSTLDDYTQIAKKTISKFANRMYPALVAKMLSDDEFVYEVAGSIMTADWKWDPNRVGKNTGKKKTLYSYRNQCALWAIKTLVTKKYRSSQKHSKFLKHVKENLQHRLVYETTPESSATEKEGNLNLINDVKNLINYAPISEKQKNIIKRYYYDNYTLSQIGKEYNVSREAIRQQLKKGIKEIQDYANSAKCFSSNNGSR